MSFVRGSDNSFWSLFDASFLQELLVLATFAISFTLWRLQKQRYTPNLKSGYEAKAESHAAKVSKIPFTLEEEEQAKASEEKLLQMLATSNFTRALNLYRGYERCGLEVFFSEELFKSFIHAGIRVNKHDVVERMLRSMRRLNRRPSCQFWQQTMKLLSSRKHFTQCLVVYGIFEHQMPIDKVIFSCLINAALECKQLERIPDLLEKFSQASLVAKDHILHFRCYVQLGRAKDAQELFHRLSPEVSNLMLNLALLTSVNQQDPDGAYELLQSAKLIEQRNQGPNQEKLVDIVSYNTVMKGYGSAKYRSQCFECMKELIEHGLQPDEISLASLMDACIAENDEQLANEIGDLLLSKNLKPQMCTLFILSLVRAGAITKALALYDIMKRHHVFISMWRRCIVVCVLVALPERIKGYSPDEHSRSTLVAVESSGNAQLIRSQTKTSGVVEAGNPYNKMSKMFSSQGHDEDSIITTADSVNKSRPVPTALEILRRLLPALVTVVVGFVAAVIYRCTKRWPAPEMATETDLQVWSSGHFDCLAEPMLCCMACCCPCIRWADTMDMANVIGFWPAAAVFLFLIASNFWLPAFVIINIALLIYGRQMLRKGFAMKEQTTARSLCGDCLYVSFCTPCAITQEARHVEKAAKVKHPLLESRRGLVPSQESMVPTPAAPTAAVATPTPRPAPVASSSAPEVKQPELPKPAPAPVAAHESDEEF